MIITETLKYHLLICFIMVAKVSHMQVLKFEILFYQRSNKSIVFTATKSQSENVFRHILPVNFVELTLADKISYDISES